MTEPIDYRLVNRRKRELKLRAQRHEIIISDDQKALDKILDAPSPVTLVQSFEDQDLYYLMHKIGPEDFIPVLSMATSDQWEYIMDVEIWRGDRIDLPAMARIFDLLFQADPNRLLRWGIKEKPACFEYFLSKNITIWIREHDEPPPSDFDDYITLDDKFYFRFPDKPIQKDGEMPVPGDSTPTWELIEKMVKTVAQMDLSVFHGVLLETQGLLLLEVEEEEYRLKNIRLAEKGFMPTHEAIGIYQPTALERLRRRPGTDMAFSPFDPDIPLPPQFYMAHISGEDLFTDSLQHFAPDFVILLESELAALVNKVISADKIKLRTRYDLEKAIKKTHAYLNLGLEIITTENKNPDPAHVIISRYYLEDIFRTASRSCIQLKTDAASWFKKSFMNRNRLPLSFLDENYLGIIGGLLIERPMFFDDYQTQDRYRDFKTMSDIEVTRTAMEEVMAVDDLIGRLNVDTTTFTQGMLTYKTLLLTLWARSRLSLPFTLEPIDIELFEEFFAALFAHDKSHVPFEIQLEDLLLWLSEAADLEQDQVSRPLNRILQNLMHELQQEYGHVKSTDLDPRFIPHFLLINKKGDADPLP